MIDQIKKPEKTPIILDLNTVDFERDIKDGEVWQQDAVYEFNKRLTNTALQARKYERTQSNNPIIIHDAIFIGGARGTGKTVFLQNIKSFWKKCQKDNDLDIKIHFCNSIDPTLLVDHDNFANVVIAHLYNEVENNLESKSGEGSSQDAFYNALRGVSKSLGKQEHLDDGLSGLDRIVKYRSGIQLVSHFDTYINECKNVLEVDAIVLPIDDIDMALGRSYEVLDVVRRLLGCPKIIPVITGDLELYEPIIENRFIKDQDNKSNEIIASKQAKKLTQEYLKKVIPHNNRISLAPIARLLPSMKIIDFGTSNIRSEITYQYYIKKLMTCFFGPLNGEEKSCDWPKPESAREVTQLIRDISPSELKTENRAELWQRYKVWACLKQNDVAYSNAITAQQIEDLRDDKNLDYVTLTKLHAFNPLMQMEDLTPKWQGKKFFEEQVADNLNTDNLLAKDMYQYFEKYKGRTVYKSMPVIEHFYSKFKLGGDVIIFENVEDMKNEEEPATIIRNNKRMLLDIFTYNNYYSLGLKTQRQIFFSRAYELLTISLLNFDFNTTNNHSLDKKARKRKWKPILQDLFGRVPFYTVPALFPTKAFNIGTENEEESANSLKAVSKMTINELANDIATWEMDNVANLQGYKNESLMPILFAVFNKVFTQVRLLKDTVQKSQNYPGETLSDLALRFKYITINAFATFMKPAPVVLQNVAFTPNLDLIRDFNQHRSYSPPIRDNIGYFFKFPGKKGNDQFSKIKEKLTEEYKHKALLLQVIARHPIFELLEKQEMSNGAFNLFKKNIFVEKIEAIQVAHEISSIQDSTLEETNIPEIGVEPVTIEELKKLHQKVKEKEKFNKNDHLIIFGLTEGEITAWKGESKHENKNLVVQRAKLICELLGLSFNHRLAKVKFYTDNLKDL